MRIGNSISSISFGRALSTKEEKDFTKTAKAAKKALGIDDGTTIFKIYAPSLPMNKQEDTGLGKLYSEDGLNFLRTMNVYTDADADKVMPNGKFDDINIKRGYIPYLRGALTIGEDCINFSSLVHDEDFGGIVSESEFNKFVENNNSSHKPNWVNYENELGFDSDYPILELLESAYQRVLNPQNDSQKELLERFNEFKNKDICKVYDRLAVASLIIKGELPENFFSGFETSPEKKIEFEKLKKEHAKEIDFFKFSQFISQEQHKKAKTIINEQGRDLWGDCLINFGKYEQLAFPDAFTKDASCGWGIPVLNYDTIFDENSQTHCLFKNKLEFFLENYDGIRFDVGWSYINPKIEHKNAEIEHKNFEDKLLKFIDKTAKSVKGKDFDTRKLVYEADASFEDFSYIDPKTKKVKPYLKNHTLVLTSQYQNLHGWDGIGWNNPEFFKTIGMDERDYTLGHNHDVLNLRGLSEQESDLKDENISVLSHLLKIDKKKLADPKTFVKAKFAQLFLAKNRYMMFFDVLGTKDVLDSQTEGTHEYRTRISDNWEREYHTSLQSDNGFNLMESLQMAMKAKGLDKKNKSVYKKVEYFSNLLKQSGVKTRLEADKLEAASCLNDTI